MLLDNISNKQDFMRSRLISLLAPNLLMAFPSKLKWLLPPPPSFNGDPSLSQLSDLSSLLNAPLPLISVTISPPPIPLPSSPSLLNVPACSPVPVVSSGGQ